MSTNTTISSGPDETELGRFSTGMERITATPSTLRVGRFSDGQALPLTVSPAQFGSFADGQVPRPDATARLRVGSFGDGYDTAIAPRASVGRLACHGKPLVAHLRACDRLVAKAPARREMPGARKQSMRSVAGRELARGQIWIGRVVSAGGGEPLPGREVSHSHEYQ